MFICLRRKENFSHKREKIPLSANILENAESGFAHFDLVPDAQNSAIKKAVKILLFARRCCVHIGCFEKAVDLPQLLHSTGRACYAREILLVTFQGSIFSLLISLLDRSSNATDKAAAKAQSNR